MSNDLQINSRNQDYLTSTCTKISRVGGQYSFDVPVQVPISITNFPSQFKFEKSISL